MNPQANNDKPTNNRKLEKLWNPIKSEYVYILTREYIGIIDKEEDGKKVHHEVPYYRAEVQNELSEEQAKKNAEHYGIEMPTEEFDDIAYWEEQNSIKEKYYG